MQTESLEFFTSQELINELMRRKTFLGIVVQSDEELKRDAWNGDGIFKVHYNSNLDSGRVCRLLGVLSNYMERNNS